MHHCNSVQLSFIFLKLTVVHFQFSAQFKNFQDDSANQMLRSSRNLSLELHVYESILRNSHNSDHRDLALYSRPKSLNVRDRSRDPSNAFDESVDFIESAGDFIESAGMTWLWKIPLNKYKYPSAICNDGSPAAFYFGRGSTSSKVWLVHLEVVILRICP
jgi:hypothetical protein